MMELLSDDESIDISDTVSELESDMDELSVLTGDGGRPSSSSMTTALWNLKTIDALSFMLLLLLLLLYLQSKKKRIDIKCL